jgi:hypothetical protein
MSVDRPLLDAIHIAAASYNLPPLLLKALIGVLMGQMGASASHPDGVMQMIAPTRGEVIPALPRAYKLLALGRSEDASLRNGGLDDLFSSAFANQNLVAQVLCGAHSLHNQLTRFDDIVVLAALAYSAGSGAVGRLVQREGSDLRRAARLYHRTWGPAPTQASLSLGKPNLDAHIGAWLDYSVIANDSGQAIPNYGFVRQVPGRGEGLLDFIFQPARLAPLGLFEEDTTPPLDEANDILVACSL